MGLKYEKLTEQLIKNSYEKVELSYDELEKILDGKLPKTMIKNGLTLKSKIGRSILNGGFIVKSNSAKKKKLILEKNEKLSKKRLNNITPCPKDEINKKIFLNVIFPKGAKYLNSLENIGHEIIDIFGGDNGEYHYYLNPYGLVDKNNIPNYIISISSVSKRVYKILNLAVVEKEEEDSISKKPDCNDLYEKQKEKFKYNDIFLENYFKDNHSGNTLLSSFRCKGIYEPVDPLYITFNLQGKRDNFINLISTNPGRTTNFKVFNKEDQKNLKV